MRHVHRVAGEHPVPHGEAFARDRHAHDDLRELQLYRLKGQIQSLMQKGDFMSDDFLDEVRTIIR